MLGALYACSSGSGPAPSLVEHPTGSAGASGAAGSDGNGGDGGTANPGSGGSFYLNDGLDCETTTCEALGWACGYTVDSCGNVLNCADEGRTCAADQVCSGGIDGPTVCVAGGASDCSVCGAIPDCADAPQPTRLSGRVVTPGRNDADTDNQIGVPNAIVYILRNDAAAELPAMTTGIPSGGTSCDRCEDQDLGPVLVGAVTDANGNYVLEGNVPVGQEFLLVVKAGKFRRVVAQTLAPAAACTTTTLSSTLPDNPTRLPRAMDDGLAVNLPRIAVSTGQIDAMECVFAKMGIATAEFGNPGASGNGAARIHLYRGGSSGTPAGARIDGSTPHDSALYDDLARLQSYDMIVSDCEGPSWDSSLAQRNASGAKVREYVNRGGRMFASHLSFSWLHENGSTTYQDASDPIATGLGPAATWSTSVDSSTDSGTGRVSVGHTNASPRIDNFNAWMEAEGILTGTPPGFDIVEPRSQNTGLGAASEEFVYRDGGTNRVQQFSFNTPYAAPEGAACGRVAYSGFHVTPGSVTNATFPDHCDGDLTDQEKVLLYMLFDLGACVGAPPVPPPCVPLECSSSRCGYTPDGCGNVLDCGPCRPPQ
ncbi:MAG TPA: hypothetical protein VJU61_21355 [Polyangiaceae bacterium]|nr:hypothetical protein [Polyangiaceae bacterium]